MKLNWLASLAIALFLGAGMATSAALADNKGNFKFSNSSSGHSGHSNASRSKGNGSSPMQTQIKTFPSSSGQQSGIRQFSPNLSGIHKATGGLNAQIKPNLNHLDIIKKPSGGLLNSGIKHSDITKKIGDVVMKPQINLKPDLVHKLNPAVLNGKKLDPGFNQKCHPGNNFCKIGCYPWWCHPTWGSNCNYYPCYPHYCPQPIVIPVQAPVVTTVGVVEEQILQIPVGSTVTLGSAGLGDMSGQVVAQMDKIAFPAKVNEWKTDSVNATLPLVGLSSSVRGEILLIKADGSLAHSVKVEFLPAPQPTDATNTSTTVVQ